MKEIMKMDDKELNEMWMLNLRYKKKKTKKQKSIVSFTPKR